MQPAGEALKLAGMVLPKLWRLALHSFWWPLVSSLVGAAPVNIILLLADDLGAHDLGITGSKFHETPHLDQLAREGMRFTQAYSACTVCSPTRAALLTGKYPARLKLTDWIAGHEVATAKLRVPDWTQQLPLAEITLAEALGSAGYVAAHLGKWHLGGEGFGPETQGYSLNLGGDHRGQPPSYFSPYKLPKLSDGPAGEYLTDREGSEAARFIQEQAAKPFFLQVCFHGVHTPLQAPAELVEKYRRKAATVGGGQRNPTYAAMLERLDAAVGRILNAVDAAGLRDRTAILFTSDNGGLVLGKQPPTDNSPLRSGKGSPYEGGLRVPLLVRWPGQTTPGTTCDTPVITMDLTASIWDLTGVTHRAVDGRSLGPLFRDPNASLGRTNLYWHYPHYHPGGATPYAAIRAGDWKLIQYYEDGRHELFHLRSDPSETSDLAATYPEKVMELARQLFDGQNSLGAQWPMPNPNWNPPILQPAASGLIQLHARAAAVHGTVLRYEPMPFKNTLGWWGRTEDWAAWTFQAPGAGTYEVEILQGCGTGSGGSEVAVEVAGQSLKFIVQDTGHFQNFVPRRLGRIQLSAGTHTLALKPQRKPGGAVMDMRQVQLWPVADAP